MFEVPHQERWSDHTYGIRKYELLVKANAHIVESVDTDTIHEDIVGSMDVKAFFDLGIWC